MTQDDWPIVQLVAAQRALLIERLTSVLASLHPTLRADVLRALQGEGKLLSQPQADASRPVLVAGMWGLITFQVAHYVAPGIDVTSAANVALAVESFVCATDLLDDIEDGDQTTTLRALGQARALNVSTALLTLAHQLILSLISQGSDPRLILRLLEAFEASTLCAVSGQHRDILSEQQPLRDFSQEECLNIAAAKAGSLVRLALQMGAICAGADDGLLQQLSELGELLGIAHQLDNDAHDLYDLLQGNPDLQSLISNERSARSAKTDLERGKKTLPIVLAAGQNEMLQRSVELTDDEKKELLRTFNEAIVTTWGMCLLYRERTRECLQALEARKPVTPSLRMLLGLA